MWLLVLFSRVIRRTKIKNGSQLSTERGRNLLHAVYLTPIFPVVLGLPAADRNRAARFAKHDSFPRWGGRKGALVLFISWKVLCEISHRVFCIVDTTAQRSGAERSLLRACNVPNWFRNTTFADSRLSRCLYRYSDIELLLVTLMVIRSVSPSYRFLSRCISYIYIYMYMRLYSFSRSI